MVSRDKHKHLPLVYDPSKLCLKFPAFLYWMAKIVSVLTVFLGSFLYLPGILGGIFND